MRRSFIPTLSEWYCGAVVLSQGDSVIASQFYCRRTTVLLRSSGIVAKRQCYCRAVYPFPLEAASNYPFPLGEGAERSEADEVLLCISKFTERQLMP